MGISEGCPFNISGPRNGSPTATKVVVVVVVVGVVVVSDFRSSTETFPVFN